MRATRILVADDDQAILRTCRKILEHAGYEVTTAPDGDSALNLLKSTHYELFLVDMLMPGLSGLETVTLARQVDPTLMILMFTAYATIQTAVEAIKRGVFDYLAKPFTADQLLTAVAQSLRQKQLLEETFNLHGQLTNDLGFDKILGTSEAMQKLFGTLQKVVRTNANILIQGETGTGKDLVARTIHAHSFRRDKPFLAIDCAALPENLLESELFGYEKGAFTGADRLKRGQLELAHTGTLFLDEIGELSYALQAKLLRTLQEREFRRLGSERQILVDIRVISATSRDLRNEIVAKKFRQELYYRLSAVTVKLPPLRDRQDDIPILADHFLSHYCQEYQLAPPEVCAEVRKLFAGHEWPGNVRELQNVIQHTVLMAEGKSIELCDLPEYFQTGSRAEVSFLEVRDKEAETVERPFLENLLKRHHGNISKVAAEAKLSRKTVYRLAKRFSFDLGQFR
jgi:two-component system response regulator HydG